MFMELKSEQRFLYQEISMKVKALSKLGLSHRVIAAEMGVDRNTVWKALQWEAGREY